MSPSCWAPCSASRWPLPAGLIVYGTLKLTVGIRLEPEQEFIGSDLSIHKIGATTEREAGW